VGIGSHNTLLGARVKRRFLTAIDMPLIALGGPVMPRLAPPADPSDMPLPPIAATGSISAPRSEYSKTTIHA
jgi:hypothetical protein